MFWLKTNEHNLSKNLVKLKLENLGFLFSDYLENDLKFNRPIKIGEINDGEGFFNSSKFVCSIGVTSKPLSPVFTQCRLKHRVIFE